VRHNYCTYLWYILCKYERWKSGESQYIFYTPKINRNYGKTISTFINITDHQNNNKVGWIIYINILKKSKTVNNKLFNDGFKLYNSFLIE